MKKQSINIALLIFALLAVLPIMAVSNAEAALGDFLFKWGAEYNFNVPIGIAVDGSGNVYVADTYNHRIQVFDGNGTFLRKWGSYGTGNGRFRYPNGIAVDGSGNVYVADSQNHRIQVFDSDGTYLIQWGGPGSGNGQFNYPQGIAVDGPGNVYVADTYNHRIQVFDSTGTHLDTWGGYGTGNGQFRHPRGIALDGPGNVYVADNGNHRIQVFDSMGTHLDTWGRRGNVDGQFRHPCGIAVDGSGNVYVADSQNYRIQVFDSTGTFLGKWGSKGTVYGQFNYPQGIAVDGLGNVYVADTYNRRIQVFSSAGTFITDWGTWGARDGQFYNPTGMAVAGSGNVYVADTWNSRIQVFDSMGTHLDTWGGDGTGYRGAGSGIGQFRSPCGIAVDGLGNVYVADTGNYRIQVFDSEGTYLFNWGGRGDGNGQFRNPRGIAVDGLGNVYVADYSDHRIQVFDSDGTYLFQWGSQGGGNGQFYYPWGIATDAGGNVYVADAHNHRIQVFDSMGTHLDTWGGFRYPYGIAVGVDGNVYVADSGRQSIQVRDSGGTLLRVWGGLGPADGKFLWPYAITLGAGGNVYVADTDNHRIQVFDGFNSLPVADAGPDQTVECVDYGATPVTLDGSGSYDPNGDPLTYTWTPFDPPATGVSAEVTMPYGTSTVTLTVDDGISGSDWDTANITVADTTAPVTTAIINGTMGDNGWYVSDVTVTLNATDGCTGVKEIHYTINGLETVVPGETATFTLAEDGIYAITYWAVDNAGIAETADTTPVQRETTKPVTTPTVPAPPPGTGGHHTGCVNVQLDTTASSSGTAVTQYSFDGVTWYDYTGQFTVCSDGATDVYYKAKSNAGNAEAPKTITIKIDTTPPVTTHSLSGAMGNDGWYVSDVTVTLTATDAASGVAEIHYVLDGVEQVVTANTATFTVSQDGVHSLTYWAKDVAGIVEAQQGPVSFKIDQTMPVITITGVTEGVKYPACSPPTPSYSVTDAASGLATHSATLEGGNANGVGTFTYTVTATDNAGNTVTETVTYKVVYSFDGFQTPVTLSRPFKLGSTIPVKFVLTDGCGAYVSNATATLSVVQLSGAEPLGEPIDGTTNVPDSGNVFRYVLADNHYIYNLSTGDSLSTGTWRVTATLDDGETYSVDIGIK